MTQKNKPRRGGKPVHEPTEKTRAEVSALRSFGVPISEIANYMGINFRTLRKHYGAELDLAKTQADANVAKFLYRTATGAAIKDGAKYSDCVRAAMFWAKTRMEWRETNNLDLTSSDGSMSPGDSAADAAIQELMRRRAEDDAADDEEA